MKASSPLKQRGRILSDPDLCQGCEVCLLACSLWQEGENNPSLARLRVEKDMVHYTFSISVCQHCSPPPCLEACPVEAMSLDERGVVLIDEQECIRCGSCAERCPYGAIFYDERTDRYLKCELCTAYNGEPLCVAICPTGALHWQPEGDE